MRATRLVVPASILCAALLAGRGASAADRYIRAGATGNSSGDDWTNAWPSFADADMTRGDTYYVASGTYAENVVWTPPASGSTWIYVKKATSNAHGAASDWDDAYANGPAVIEGTLQIGAYVDWDGVTGSEDSGHGFQVVRQDCASDGNVVSTYASHVNISHMEIQQCGEATGFAQDGLYSVLASPLESQHFRYLYIHDCGRNGISLFGQTSDILIEHCRFERVQGIGDVHSQAIQLTGPPMSGITVRYNQFVDIMGQAALSLLGSNGELYQDIYFYDNILWSTDSVTYWYAMAVFGREGTSQTNVLVYNNTFFNVRNPCTWMQGAVVTNCENRNNIYVDSFFQYPHRDVTSTNNVYFNNTGNNVPVGETEQVDGTFSPFVNAPADFHLVAEAEAVDRGMTLGSDYASDYDGVSRPQGAAWDIGAYEYLSGGQPDAGVGGGAQGGSGQGGNGVGGNGMGASSGTTHAAEDEGGCGCRTARHSMDWTGWFVIALGSIAAWGRRKRAAACQLGPIRSRAAAPEPQP